MAFQQSTRQAFHRSARLETEDRQHEAQPFQSTRPVEESQTWVLFSPATDAGTSASYLSSIHDSQPTPGRSRISDLGSLNTIARSDLNSQPVNSAVPGILSSDDHDEESAVDDAELDSLDSHLPDFRSVPHAHMQSAVLPTHDGLGSFQLGAAAIGPEMQDHLYAFERFNPRRVRRRRESLELAQQHLEQEEILPSDRHARIEAWRLEQSKLLLDEIQKETRRRRISDAVDTALAREHSDPSSIGEPMPDVVMAGGDWHDQEEPEPAEPEAREPEGLLSRLALRFMHEFMGIDERMLSILFGEVLPDEEELSSTPKASIAERRGAPAQAGESYYDSSWQLRLLERISRELGMVIHRLTPHPGAFSTYVRMQQMPLPYAGLPAIPESAADPIEGSKAVANDSTTSLPQFKPTIQQAVKVDVAARVAPGPDAHSTTSQHGAAAFSQEEWEQNLDIKLVFRYLRSRFLSRSTGASVGTSHLAAAANVQDAAAKAARIRQHHPLLGRTRPADRRSFRVTTPSSPVAMRHGSTCASQSTRRSARRSSVSSRASSRHYWDIGGSMGTGSMIASAGPMGSWGEV